MKLRRIAVLIVIIILISCFTSPKIIKREILNFHEYIDTLNFKYGNDEVGILNKINNEIDNWKNSKEFIGVNLLAREYYYHTWEDTENLTKYADETERYLLKYNMYYELSELYSILANEYAEVEEYKKAYIYIYKGERIAIKLYEDHSSDENLIELVELKYFKAVVALNIRLNDQAEESFNEAEELRKAKLQNIKEVNMFMNILLYYKIRNEYNLVKEYGERVIELIEKSDQKYETYHLKYIKAKFILANNYIYLDEIERCIEIIDELKKDIMVFTFNETRHRMYYLYARVYEYYEEYEECLNNLQKAYNEIRDSNLNIKKLIIIEEIIEMLKMLDHEDELIKWYTIEMGQVEQFEEITEVQYFFSKLLDTDLQYANYNIEILNLQKQNITYVVKIMLLIILTVLIYILYEFKKRKLLKENVSILAENMEVQRKYYEGIISHDENIKIIKHDIKNHIAVIKELLDKGEVEYINKYINKINLQLASNDEIRVTNNKIIDSIIVNKLNICKKNNIDVDLDIKLPEEISIDDFDLCVIYGNLIDNAIEACERITNKEIKKYINIKSKIKGDYLFINIRNSHNSKIKTFGEKFITSKKDEGNHGIGISSVKKSLNKYSGDIKIDYTNNEFNISVILLINRD